MVTDLIFSLGRMRMKNCLAAGKTHRAHKQAQGKSNTYWRSESGSGEGMGQRNPSGEFFLLIFYFLGTYFFNCILFLFYLIFPFT